METQRHNVACIQRADEQANLGRCATYQPGTGTFRVPSRTNPKRPPYRVRVHAVGDQVSVACNCEAGRSQPPLGSTPCWHGASACMEAARLDLVTFDGSRWVLGTLGAELTRKAPYAASGPVCAACGESVDDLVLVPVWRQAVKREGELVHRGCAAVGAR